MVHRIQGNPSASHAVTPLQSRVDYQALSEFRYRIQCFLEISQDAARSVGLTPRQHQALLAIKGFKGAKSVSVSDLAERLRIRHNSAAELVDRLTEAHLVECTHDSRDHRRVLITLTPRAEQSMADLSTIHRNEQEKIKSILDDVTSLLK